MSDLLYTLNEGRFYESAVNYSPTDDTVISLLRDLLPKTWTFENYGIWLIGTPPEHPLLPKAGFKIHVSTRPENRERILTVSAKTVANFNTVFKCLTDWNLWTLLHDKPYADDLFQYGKSIVIYPHTKEQAFHIASLLAEDLRGESGPDILTDTPFGDSTTVYYRYSRYFPTLPEDDDEINDTHPELALTAPEWVPPPPQNRLDKYQIIEAIQVSAAGGVYAATRQNRKYIIKEANADTCVSNGRDAIDRLRSELNILQKLADANLKISSEPIDSFRYWRNFYIVMEHLPGETLTEVLKKSISIDTRLDIATRLFEVVATLHDHNVCWGDVSPTNVLYDRTSQKTSQKIYLLDFENASLSENRHAATHAGTPGFSRNASENRALAYLLFYIFLPVNAAFEIPTITPSKFFNVMRGRLPKQLIEVIENALKNDVSAKRIARHLSTVKVAAQAPHIPDTSQEQRPSHRYTHKIDSILHFIKAHLSFQRTDRLFPCSPDGFVYPLSIAYGATGLASILRDIGGSENTTLAEQAVDWVFSHTDFNEHRLAATPGFYDGTAGIAYIAGAFGEEEYARKCIQIAAEQIQNTPKLDVYNGIAGVADAGLRLFRETDDELYLNTAKRLADALISKAVAVDTNDTTRIWKDPDGDIQTGYLFGTAGIATLLIKIAEHLKDTPKHQQYADIGTQALLWVEKQVLRGEDGCLTIPDTYARNFARGTAGIAHAFIQARTRFGTEKDSLIQQLLQLPEPLLSHTPRAGYFYGITGIGTTFLDVSKSLGDTGYLRQAEHLLEEIFCFEVIDTDTEGIGFPGGDTLQRLACDLATGSLGIVQFLHRLLMEQQSVDRRSSTSEI